MSVLTDSRHIIGTPLRQTSPIQKCELITFFGSLPLVALEEGAVLVLENCFTNNWMPPSCGLFYTAKTAEIFEPLKTFN